MFIKMKLNGVPIEGAIFDLDGTLLDSMPAWFGICGDYLRHKGLQPRPDVDEAVRTMSLPQAAECIREAYALPDSAEEITHEALRMMECAYFDTIPAKPGAAALLRRLHGAGIPMCVATASDRRLAQAALERLDLLPYLGEIFTCAQLGVSKNSPEIYETARKYLGTPKAHTVVFEDSLHAAATAAKAGFPVAAVYDEAAAADREALRQCAVVYLDTLEGWSPQV